jgi:hypothetical protein
MCASRLAVRLWLCSVVVAGLLVAGGAAGKERLWDMLGKTFGDHDFSPPDRARVVLRACLSEGAARLGCEEALAAALGAADAAGRENLLWRCARPKGEVDSEHLRVLFVGAARELPEVLEQPAYRLLAYAIVKASHCGFR